MRTLAVCLLLLLPAVALAQDNCPAGFVCVEKADMASFVQLARDQKCRAEQPPKVTSDGISVITDRMGRVYGSGTGPRPYEVKIDWCNYKLTAKTELKLSVAQRVEPDWGFRLRLKPMFGVMITEPFRAGRKFQDALDGGILIEPFYYHWANLNGFLGLRSFGVGLGLDITKNMTAYAGYGVIWGSWLSTVLAGVGFSLW